MTKLCFLKKFDVKYIDKIDEKSIIFPLDYQSLDILEKRKINYKIIDNYLSEEDRKDLFLKCRKSWEQLSKKTDYAQKGPHM